MGVFELDFMLAHRRSFIETISAHYPLSREALDRYANILSWPHLSGNDELPWDRGLVEAHAASWSWAWLGACLGSLAERARSVEPLRLLVDLGPSYYAWGATIEARLGDRARLEALVSAGETVSFCRVVEWADDAAAWIPALFERAAEPTRRELWHALSYSQTFPWTIAFIDAHADALCWRCASGNPGLPWSPELVLRHESRWSWTELLQAQLSSERDDHLEAILDLAGDRIDWSRVDASDVVWTAERFDSLRARFEARAAQESTSTYWTFALAPRLWTPGFVERLDALQAEIGRATIDWRALARHGGERLWTRAFCERHRDRLDPELLAANPAVAVMLEPEAVEAFLSACARPLTHLVRDLGLEAAIVAAPDDFAGYEAYADWLEERGDAQADLIRAMCGVERWTVESSVAGRLAAELANELGIEHELQWRRGFVRKAAWIRHYDTGDWRFTLRLRPFALVEELRILDGAYQGLGMFDQTRIRDEDWELLASLPCLTKLALHHASIERTSKLRQLGRITDLDLHGTFVFDPSVFAGMPALRSLVLNEELCALYWSGLDSMQFERHIDDYRARIDLRPLAEIPGLRHLGLRGTMVGCDLRQLRGCRSLETLELVRVPSMSETYDLYDLSALDELPQLRRLWIFAAPEAAELDALRARHPRLAINMEGEPRPWSAHPELFSQRDPEGWARLPEGLFDD